RSRHRQPQRDERAPPHRRRHETGRLEVGVRANDRVAVGGKVARERARRRKAVARGKCPGANPLRHPVEELPVERLAASLLYRHAGLEVRGNAASHRAEDLRSEIMADYVLGRISHDVWAERTARALGDLYAIDEITRMHDAWIHDEYAGVADIVDELYTTGIATGCLSNTNHAHW